MNHKLDNKVQFNLKKGSNAQKAIRDMREKILLGNAFCKCCGEKVVDSDGILLLGHPAEFYSNVTDRTEHVTLFVFCHDCARHARDFVFSIRELRGAKYEKLQKKYPVKKEEALSGEWPIDGLEVE